MRSYRHILHSCSLILASVTLHAQWYTIPDPGFVQLLQVQYPQLMNGDQLNIEHPDLDTITWLGLMDDGYFIESLDGLQHFTNVEQLVLQYMNVWDIQFPPQMEVLGLNGSFIMPDVLTLPPTLRKLHLQWGSSLMAMEPFEMPGSLEAIYLEDGGFDGVDWFGMTNALDTLIVQSGSNMFFYYNPIQSWPTELSYLHLGGLVSPESDIPDLFETQLEYIYFDFPVPAFGPFPPTLRELWTRGSGTNCLPPLPNEMELLALAVQNSATQINCLSNHPPDMNIHFFMGDFWELDTCTIFNSLCFGGNTVSGNVFLDTDGDGIFGGADLPIMNRTVQAQPTNILTGSGSNGAFEMQVPAGEFELVAEQGMYDASSAPPPLISFTSVGNASSGHALAMSATASISDLGIDITGTVARPGFPNIVWITVTNNGTVPLGGEVTFEFDPAQEWGMSDPAATPVGNIVQWTLSPLQLGEVRLLEVTLYTPMTVELGDLMEHTASVSTTPADNDPLNDQVVYKDEVVGSYDPNDKLVDPAALTPEAVLNGATLVYTIRFQNTGTWLAETVRIEDVLSEEHDLNSFKFLSGSHSSQWMITEDRTLQILFPEIMLPDSNANEPESHGFFRFEIDVLPGLLLGDMVENIAAIYFDFNEPIITEPAVFSVETGIGMDTHSSEQMLIWPNPVDAVLNLQLQSGEMIGLIEIIDITGRTVRSLRSNASMKNIDVVDLPEGNYVIRLTSTERTYRGRFVKR